MMQVSSWVMDPYNIYNRCDGLAPEVARKKKSVEMLSLTLKRIMKKFDDREVCECVKWDTLL